MAHKPLKKIYIDLLIITIGFAVLGHLFKFPYLYIISGIALLAGIHPYTASIVSLGWEKFGKFLGKINSAILLTLFFVFFITPFSLLYKLISKKRHSENSNWIKSDAKTDFSKPY